MIPRAALVQLGKLVAQDLSDGHVSDALSNVGETLASQPKALLTLVDLVAKEGAKKKPDDGLITAYAFILVAAGDDPHFFADVRRPSASKGRTAPLLV